MDSVNHLLLALPTVASRSLGLAVSAVFNAVCVSIFSKLAQLYTITLESQNENTASAVFCW